MQKKLFNPWYVDDDSWGVELTEETPFKGTVIQIKSLDFLEENSPEVSLDFFIISKPEGLSDEDYKSKEFNEIMQNIVEQLLRQVIEEHANRETDSK